MGTQHVDRALFHKHLPRTGAGRLLRWLGYGIVILIPFGFAGAVGAGADKLATTRHEGFVVVQGGKYQMGDVWGDGPFAMNELPVHEVRVDDFLLAKFEVTVVNFREFVTATGYKSVAEQDAGVHPSLAIVRSGKRYYPSWRTHFFDQQPDHPVVMVGWEDAVAYCNWLSRRNNLPAAYDENNGQLLDAAGRPSKDIRRVAGFRLPTEAEWEFAARNRGQRVRFGNGQDIARASQMNFDAAGTGSAVPSLRLPRGGAHPYNEPGATRAMTTPVGTFPPNALGIFDLSGNAWEWCSDTGGDYTPERQVNPCAQGGTTHVLRGGNYDTDAKACRVSARIDWGSRSFCSASGFRVALTIQ